MLDIASYKKNLYGKKILENSCGDGNILTQIVKRYIESCRSAKISDDLIIRGLENDITAVEYDKKHYDSCIENLNKVALQYKLSNISWNVVNADALKYDYQCKYDFIIGNPPYINYREMNIETRNYLKENFSTCKNGKVDYCYAFIQKSVELLADNGLMVYLIPNCIFKNVFAKNVREFIKPHLIDIYDYTTQHLFGSVLTSSAIIKIKNGKTVNSFNYHDVVNKCTMVIKKACLLDKWVFEVKSSDKLQISKDKFGDYFKASCSIATLCNDVFVFEPDKEDNKYFYLNGTEKIEKAITRESMSPRSKSYNKQRKIIFPYYYEKNILKHHSEIDIRDKFPQAYSYLKKFKEKLLDTDKDNSAEWFEYGRSQGLRHLNQRKLLVSSVITKKVNCYLLKKSDIPFSGIYIVQTGDYPLSLAFKILTSQEFIDYVKKIGVNARSGSMRISPKDINNFNINIQDV